MNRGSVGENKHPAQPDPQTPVLYSSTKGLQYTGCFGKASSIPMQTNTKTSKKGLQSSPDATGAQTSLALCRSGLDIRFHFKS